MTDQTIDQVYDRTLYEARLDARFYQQFHTRNARLFRHLYKVFSAITLLSGMAAVTLLVKATPALAATVGLVFAVITVLDNIITPAENAAKHDAWAEKYGMLFAESEVSTMTLTEFDGRLHTLIAQADTGGIVALRALAYNDNVIAVGRQSYAIPLTTWQRFVAALA